MCQCTYLMLFMFGGSAGGIGSALDGGAISNLIVGGQEDDSGWIEGDVLSSDYNIVGMCDGCFLSDIQGSNFANHAYSLNRYVYCDMG